MGTAERFGWFVTPFGHRHWLNTKRQDAKTNCLFDILDIKRETQFGTVSKGENGIMVIIKKHHFILIIISWMLVVLVQAKTHLFHISELYEEDGRIVLFPLIYISKGQWFFAVLKNKCALWVQAIFQCPKHPLVHYNGLLFSLSNGRKSFSNSTISLFFICIN